MKYLSITKYLYLGIGLIMFYDAFTKWNSKSDEFWLSVILGGTAVFMFFFRNKFGKKFEQNNQNKS